MWIRGNVVNMWIRGSVVNMWIGGNVNTWTAGNVVNKLCELKVKWIIMCYARWYECQHGDGRWT